MASSPEPSDMEESQSRPPLEEKLDQLQNMMSEQKKLIESLLEKERMKKTKKRTKVPDECAVSLRITILVFNFRF